MTKNAPSNSTDLTQAWQTLTGDPARAGAAALGVLESVPAHQEARLLLGVARRLQGQVAAAREVLEGLLRDMPASPPLLFEWACVEEAYGHADAAMAALRRAVALQPDWPAPWQMLGDMLVLMGDVTEAGNAYAQALRAGVRDARLADAAAALAAHQPFAAEQKLAAHLQRSPDDAAALHLLAAAAIRLGKPVEAEAVLSHCLKLAPGFAEARHTLAVSLYLLEQFPRAARHFDILLAAAPHDFMLRKLLAGAHVRHGDFAAALPVYESLLADAGMAPRIWLLYGNALRAVGRAADAVRAYRRCLDFAPGDAEAYLGLADIKTATFSATDIGAMRAQLARPDVEPGEKARLQYALGAALERARDYAGSFAAYDAGARLQRSAIEYDAAAEEAAMAAAKRLFTAEFFAARQGAGDPSDAPIFIVGLPRSGSTLVEQILASHSDVEATMELPDLGQIADELGQQAARAGKTYGDFAASLDRAALAHIGQRYLARTRRFRRTARPRFIDKMPANFRHVGLIRLILPNARVIDVRRAPMAAGFAIFKQYFQAAHARGHARDLGEIGRYYRAYAALMAHFDAVLPGFVHRVAYERLVADTEAHIRALLAFCGLEFQPSCLRFWETERIVATPSAEQVRQPVFTSSLEQWRHYEPWLAALRGEIEKEESASF